MSKDDFNDESARANLEAIEGLRSERCIHRELPSECEICRNVEQIFKGLKMMLIAGIAIALCVAALMIMNGSGR